MNIIRKTLPSLLLLVTAVPLCSSADPEPSAEDVTFFEKEVFPILRANCFACHGGEPKIQGEFKLTSREDILKGGETGEPAAVPGKTDSGNLLDAINHRGLEMPPKRKLAQGQIDTLTR